MTALIAAAVTSSRIPPSSSQLSKLEPRWGIFLGHDCNSLNLCLASVRSSAEVFCVAASHMSIRSISQESDCATPCSWRRGKKGRCGRRKSVVFAWGFRWAQIDEPRLVGALLAAHEIADRLLRHHELRSVGAPGGRPNSALQ